MTFDNTHINAMDSGQMFASEFVTLKAHMRRTGKKSTEAIHPDFEHASIRIFKNAAQNMRQQPGRAQTQAT